MSSEELKFCVDYCKLTTKHANPLPRIEEVQARLVLVSTKMVLTKYGIDSYLHLSYFYSWLKTAGLTL